MKGVACSALVSSYGKAVGWLVLQLNAGLAAKFSTLSHRSHGHSHAASETLAQKAAAFMQPLWLLDPSGFEDFDGMAAAAKVARGGGAGGSGAGAGASDAAIGRADVGNGFAQLLVNLSAERVHNTVMRVSVLAEQVMYHEQGVRPRCDVLPLRLPVTRTHTITLPRCQIKFDPIRVPDNGVVIDLLDKRPNGFLVVFDEDSTARTSDAKMLAKFKAKHATNPCLDPKARSGGRQRSHTTSAAQCQFTVLHSVGPVSYSAHGVVGVLKAAAADNAAPVLARCRKFYAKELAHLDLRRCGDADHAGGRGRSSGRAVKASHKASEFMTVYRAQLQDVVSRLQGCTPFVVRCVRAARSLVPGEYEPKLVLAQLRTMGASEVAALARVGYPVHIAHTDFVATYHMLDPAVVAARTARSFGGVVPTPPPQPATPDGVRTLLSRLSDAVPRASACQVGTTHVLMRSAEVEALDAALMRAQGVIASRLQAVGRAWLERRVVRLALQAREGLRAAMATRTLEAVEEALAVASFLPVQPPEVGLATTLAETLHAEQRIASELRAALLKDPMTCRRQLEALIQQASTPGVRVDPTLVSRATQAVATVHARHKAKRDLHAATKEPDLATLRAAIAAVRELQRSFPQFCATEVGIAERLLAHLASEVRIMQRITAALAEEGLLLQLGFAGGGLMETLTQRQAQRRASVVGDTGGLQAHAFDDARLRHMATAMDTARVRVEKLSGALGELMGLGAKSQHAKSLLRDGHLVVSLRETLATTKTGSQDDMGCWWSIGRLLALWTKTHVPATGGDGDGDGGGDGGGDGDGDGGDDTEDTASVAAAKAMERAAAEAAAKEVKSFHQMWTDFAMRSLLLAAIRGGCATTDADSGVVAQPWVSVQCLWGALTTVAGVGLAATAAPTVRVKCVDARVTGAPASSHSVAGAIPRDKSNTTRAVGAPGTASVRSVLGRSGLVPGMVIVGDQSDEQSLVRQGPPLAPMPWHHFTKATQQVARTAQALLLMRLAARGVSVPAQPLAQAQSDGGVQGWCRYVQQHLATVGASGPVSDEDLLSTPAIDWEAVRAATVAARGAGVSQAASQEVNQWLVTVENHVRDDYLDSSWGLDVTLLCCLCVFYPLQAGAQQLLESMSDGNIRWTPDGINHAEVRASHLSFTTHWMRTHAQRNPPGV